MEALGGIFKEAAAQLKSEADTSGVLNSNGAIQGLQNIQVNAGNADTNVMKQVSQAIKDFTDTLEKKKNDPSSLAPGGGCMAACGKWYGGKVSAKLGGLQDEATTLGDKFIDLKEDAAKTLTNMKQTLGAVMPTVKHQMTELVSLPDELKKIADKLENSSSHELCNTVAGIDMDPIDKCLDVSPINRPLEDVTGLKGNIGPIIDTLQKAVQELDDFIKAAPKKLEAAFSVCPCIPGSSPPVLKELLDKLKVVTSYDLGPLVSVLTDTKKALNAFDATKIKTPIESFSKSCSSKTKELRKRLEQAQKVAKAGNMIGGLANKFGF